MEYNTKKDFDTTLEGFIHELSSVKDTEFNQVPFAGSWTAGELAQHIALSGAGFADMLNRSVKPTEREPDEHILTIKNILLDFTTKLKSPDFIIPEEKDYDKSQLIATLKDIRSSINKSVEEKDLTQTCTGFELPQLGFLTRLEAVYFVIYHTQRHTRQLKNIKAELAKD